MWLIEYIKQMSTRDLNLWSTTAYLLEKSSSSHTPTPLTLSSTHIPYSLSGELLQAAWLQCSSLWPRGSAHTQTVIPSWGHRYTNRPGITGRRRSCVVINTVQTRLMSPSKSCILADILHCLVEIYSGKLLWKMSVSQRFHSLSTSTLSASLKSFPKCDLQ